MNDADLWKSYARGVQKMGSTQDAPQTEKTEEKPKIERTTPRQPSLSLDTMPKEWRQKVESEPRVVTPIPEPLPPPPPAPKPAPAPREVLDLRIERNLSLGDVVIEAKLDLHGKTESDAHEALNLFIEAQRKRGRRLILVITGKGRDGTSVLRANLPRWCDVPPLAEHVLAVRTAAPHHGGEGAYYILLRKRSA